MARPDHQHRNRLKKGTLNVNTSTTYTAGTKKGFVNSKGKVNIASGETLNVSGVTHAVFANTKGSIAGAGQLLVNGPSTFNQGLGTITGVNVLVQGAGLEYSGTGAGTIEVQGSSTLVSPPEAATQVVDVNGTCSDNGNLAAAGNVTDQGSIELTSTVCGNNRP